MTGYGRGETEGERHWVFAEVRSVNSRYLDINLRLPTGSWVLEPMIRKLIQERFKRGRIEVYVRLETIAMRDEPEVEVHLRRAQSYQKALEALRVGLEITGEVDLPLIVSFRDIIEVRDTPLEEEKGALLEGLRKALDGVETMRLQEGEEIQSELESRIQWMKTEQERLHELSPRVVTSIIDRWRGRLKSLVAEQPFEPGRLEQEIAVWMDRLDVTEELVRLRSHITRFETLLVQGQGIGKKLEFLLQEMHREVNTFGSKVMDAELSHCAVEMKAQIERMRELVQNVE
jgi:uncharacterized protein (TIGR00255 family)